MQVWHNQLYDFGKIRSPNEAAQQVKEAGTISVLAMLQAPIQEGEITSQVCQSTKNAIRRLAAFRLIDRLLETQVDEKSIVELIQWFTSFQANSKLLLHYTDGISGCGIFFEEKLREAFFSILTKLAHRLSIETKPLVAI